MGNITIIEAIEDQNLFGSLFKDQSTWINWKYFLAVLFGLELDSKGVTLYKECTGRQMASQGRFSEAYAIVGRRGGKSFISSIIACYLALFHDWTPYLSKGEIGWIMVIASDRQQARVILNYIKAVLQIPIFNNMVEKELSWEIRLKNQVTISVKTCDYRTIRGYTVVAAICDEIAFWKVEGANPAQEILTALRPSMATIPGSLLLGISTPYSKSGPLYESFRNKWGKDDPDVLVWKAPTKIMNPTISEKTIDKALREDYSAAKAEWLAEFREDLETFLSSEMIEAAIVPRRWELPRIEGVSYYAFTDPSGGRADSFTLAIIHREGEKIILDRLEERKPPFGPQDIVREFSQIIKSYGISTVTGDKYAGEWVKRAFQDCGIKYIHSDLNKSEIYLEFEPLVAQGQVELLDNKTLFSQLRGLERRVRSGGKDQIDHYPGGNDDLANAAAGACVISKRQAKEPRIRFLGEGRKYV